MKTDVGEEKIKCWIQKLYNLSFTPQFLMHKVLSIRDLDDIKYYLRAFFDNGSKIGSKDNLECQIDLISQSFAILTNIADSNQIPSILNGS